MSWDDEYRRIIPQLMPEIEAVEDWLGSMPLLPEPIGRGEGRIPLAEPTSQIEVAADLFMDLRPDLDPRLSEIIEAYHRYWREGCDDPFLHEINELRSQFPRDRPAVMQMIATQYLTGASSWMTVQDGPIHSIALDLRFGGVPEDRVRAALRRLIPDVEFEPRSMS